MGSPGRERPNPIDYDLHGIVGIRLVDRARVRPVGGELGRVGGQGGPGRPRSRRSTVGGAAFAWPDGIRRRSGRRGSSGVSGEEVLDDGHDPPHLEFARTI